MRVNIDIALTHHGQRLEGKVVSLNPGEIQVAMTSPYDGVSATRHNYYRTDQGKPYSDGDSLTVEGKKAAGTILLDLFEKIVCFEKNRDQLSQLYQPVKSRLNEAYSRLKENRHQSPGQTESRDARASSISRQQQNLQEIFWLQHEYYRIATKELPELDGIGMDTFMDLIKRFLE